MTEVVLEKQTTGQKKKEPERSITLVHIEPMAFVQKTVIPYVSQTLQTLRGWIAAVVEALTTEFPNYKISSRVVSEAGAEDWDIEVTPPSDLIYAQAMRLAEQLWKEAVEEFHRNLRIIED